MKRKLFNGAALLLLASVVSFSSCKDDNTKSLPPAVKLTELGSGHDHPNDKIGYAGSDIHIGAEITAEGLIESITVKIRKEDGTYEFVDASTENRGLKNTTYHKHLDIPAVAPEGKYQFQLIVTDQEGQTAMAQSELTIKPGNGEHDDDHDDHDDHDHHDGHDGHTH